MSCFADAFLIGWGAVVGASRTGGHWANEELDIINYFELKSILFDLQALCGTCAHSHIRVHSDNTAAGACLVRCGSTKLRLHELTEEIFSWAESRGITLSAVHITGLHNVAANRESQLRNLDLEGMLRPHFFKKLCQAIHTPDFDFVCFSD